MALLAAAMVASAVIGGISSVQKNKAERKSLLHQQTMHNMQADEMARRAEENYALLRQKGKSAAADVESRSTSLTGAYGSDTRNALISSVTDSVYDEIARQKRVNDHDIAMKRMGAEIYGQEASSKNRELALDLGSSILGSSTNMAVAKKQGYFD